MLRRCIALAVTLAIPLLLGLATPAREEGRTHEVVGIQDEDGNNVWQYEGKSLPTKADLGKPDGRLEVPVRDGDVVLFRNEPGGVKHGVVFEKAKAEIAAGVWKVVDGPKALGPINATFKGFDQGNAQTTEPANPGEQILKIQVDQLKAGAENGILFGCNPHSKMGATPKRAMLGVIVLAPEPGGGDAEKKVEPPK